jgi:hypothetical protein
MPTNAPSGTRRARTRTTSRAGTPAALRAGIPAALRAGTPAALRTSMPTNAPSGTRRARTPAALRAGTPAALRTRTLAALRTGTRTALRTSMPTNAPSGTRRARTRTTPCAGIREAPCAGIREAPCAGIREAPCAGTRATRRMPSSAGAPPGTGRAQKSPQIGQFASPVRAPFMIVGRFGCYNAHFDPRSWSCQICGRVHRRVCPICSFCPRLSDAHSMIAGSCRRFAGGKYTRSWRPGYLVTGHVLFAPFIPRAWRCQREAEGAREAEHAKGDERGIRGACATAGARGAHGGTGLVRVERCGGGDD